MQKKIAGASALLAGLLVNAQVQAATVIDTATKSAITSGFTDMKDTMLDLLGVGFPFVVAGAVIMASPRIVKGLIKLASGGR